jgi:hypothetical protein
VNLLGANKEELGIDFKNGEVLKEKFKKVWELKIDEKTGRL